jgi:beta-galactosidase
MREIIQLNNNWKYCSKFEENHLNKNCDISNFETVNIPHTNVELPLTYFDEKDFQFVCSYKKEIFIDKKNKNKLIFVHFEAVMAYAKIYLNGEFIGEHTGGYTGFDILLNPALKFGENNILTVVADSTERDDIPPFGGQIDYLTYGGIYREIQLKIVEPVHIKNIFCKPQNILQEKKMVSIDTYINNTTSDKKTIKLKATLSKNGEVLAETIEEKCLSGAFEEIITLTLNNLKNIKLWDIENPELYDVNVEIENIDSDNRKIGFRIAEFTPNGFLLNGKPLNIMGLNRHQAFPYVGYAMPARVQKKDADILKYELSLNLVRTSHYPQSRHFLDRCDEIGLLVFEEIPGWQHIGNEEWKDVAIHNVKEMIERDWNHSSIILWGVRINESPDDHDFYKRTNKLAHELDPTRQTGGVRCYKNSELLEDVYTMNDFVLNGGNVALNGQNEVTGLAHNVPYMVTEYNGHMYPTKKQDPEERHNEHSIRHLRVIDAGNSDKNICGTIGWCAFDYNTHKDFGAGDKVCHHGVMDNFRLPKFAAYAYTSQIDPEIKPVLEPVTVWARGEKNECLISPLLIHTNCDKVEFYYNNEFIKTYFPAKSLFKGLKYPPIMIEEVDSNWGHQWQTGEFKGYKNGKLIATKKYTNSQMPKELIVEADDYELSADLLDATRIVIKLVDELGNNLFFSNAIVELKIKGPGRFIGPDKLVLQGGEIATWILTENKSGKIELTVKSDRVKEKNISIDVK